jgi:hypothetical protein
MSQAWMIFWGLLLALTLVAYVGLTVVVSLGGFRDILAMFRKLRSETEEEASGSVSETKAPSDQD